MTHQPPGQRGQLRRCSNANWLSDLPPHEWHGVTVNGQGQVTQLSLHDNTELSGALPAGFAGMDSLQRLAIANTDICIPSGQAFRDWLDTVHDKPGGVQACQ